MKRVTATILLAALLWGVMFSPLTTSHINFWWMMTASALLLSVLACHFRTGWRKVLQWNTTDVCIGIALAILLWGVFWMGDKLSSWLFDFARPQVDHIYGMKADESPIQLSLLLLFLIGPAEEIFWRGYVQHELSAHWTANKGFLITTSIYALVHAASCNFMLVMAAAVAGCVWGVFYRFFPHRMTALIVSHALWDTAVFIWFPI